MEVDDGVIALVQDEAPIQNEEAAPAPETPSAALQRLLSTPEIDINAVRELLRANPELLSETDERGHMLIHRATLLQNFALVNLILEFGVSINTSTSFGVTPIHTTAFTGNIELVEHILQIGTKNGIPLEELIDSFQGNGLSAMHIAAKKGDNRMILYLLQRGSKMLDRRNARRISEQQLQNFMNNGPHGEIPPQNQVRIAELLQMGKSPLTLAIESGKISTIELLDQLGVPLTGRSAIFDAIFGNRTKVLETLVRLGCDELDIPMENNSINTPIFYALAYRKFHVVKLLRALGAAVPSGGDAMRAIDRKMLYGPIDEDYVLKVRGTTYFDVSLTWRLVRAMIKASPMD